MTTLAEHVKTLTGPDGDGLGRVIAALAEAGKTIAAQLSRAALVGMLGTTGSKNVQGETVKKLDAWFNDIVVDALRASGRVATMVSEEMDDPVRVSGVRDGYVACFDPVDGSSNLDVNGIVGTIFSVLKKRGSGPDHARRTCCSRGPRRSRPATSCTGPPRC
jgi:fructose-1,6-bisphosphatase I